MSLIRLLPKLKELRHFDNAEEGEPQMGKDWHRSSSCA
jgi:hypothetical protein